MQILYIVYKYANKRSDWIRKIGLDFHQVAVTIRRDAGVSGRVRVLYTTVSGTATAGDDFTPIAGALTFNNGDQQKMIVIDLLQDTIPEGPEHFHVNITTVTLEEPK